MKECKFFSKYKLWDSNSNNKIVRELGVGCLKAQKEQSFCNDVAQVKSKICGGRQKDKFLIKTEPAPALNQERKSIKLGDLEQRYLSRLILSWWMSQTITTTRNVKYDITLYDI